MRPCNHKRTHDEAMHSPPGSPPDSPRANGPGTPGGDSSAASQRTALYVGRPLCESDYTLEGRADELLSLEQLSLWLELRNTIKDELLRYGFECYFESYPAPDGEHRLQMEAQLRTTPASDSIQSHLQMFRDLLDRDMYCRMLEGLLQHVRARVLSGGRPIFVADMVHLITAPDLEEPDPTIQDEASSSESSFQSDDIFTSTQHRLFAMFEDLLAEHAQHTCTRFERGLRASQVWRSMERGSTGEAGSIIRRALLPNEVEPWQLKLHDANMQQHIEDSPCLLRNDACSGDA